MFTFYYLVRPLLHNCIDYVVLVLGYCCMYVVILIVCKLFNWYQHDQHFYLMLGTYMWFLTSLSKLYVFNPCSFLVHSLVYKKFQFPF